MTEEWNNTLLINRTVNRYFRALDEKTFEPKVFAELFMADGQVMRPNGTALVGPEAIATSHRESFTRFKATQHLLSGHDVTIEDDTAHVSVNLVAIHLWKDEDGVNLKNMLGNHFTAGTVITATLQLTEDGWRICKLENKAVWRDGVGITSMAQTGK